MWGGEKENSCVLNKFSVLGEGRVPTKRIFVFISMRSKGEQAAEIF